MTWGHKFDSLSTLCIWFYFLFFVLRWNAQQALLGLNFIHLQPYVKCFIWLLYFCYFDLPGILFLLILDLVLLLTLSCLSLKTYKFTVYFIYECIFSYSTQEHYFMLLKTFIKAINDTYNYCLFKLLCTRSYIFWECIMMFPGNKLK